MLHPLSWLLRSFSCDMLCFVALVRFFWIRRCYLHCIGLVFHTHYLHKLVFKFILLVFLFSHLVCCFFCYFILLCSFSQHYTKVVNYGGFACDVTTWPVWTAGLLARHFGQSLFSKNKRLGIPFSVFFCTSWDIIDVLLDAERNKEWKSHLFTSFQWQSSEKSKESWLATTGLWEDSPMCHFVDGV